MLKKIAMMAVLLAALPAMAQDYTTISATLIADASGTPGALTSGMIHFLPTDGKGHPVSFRFPSGGQGLPLSVDCHVVNGAITTGVSGGTCRLANTALTLPVNLCYQVTITDNVTGEVVSGPGYGCYGPTGSTNNFDTFVANQTPIVPFIPVPGPKGDTGDAASINSDGTPGPWTSLALNGVANAALFTGADIGAKVNAAYAWLPATGGRIVIPAAAACYSFTTPIVFNVQSKNVVLSGDGSSCIKYTPTTGTAITFDTAGTIPHVTSTGIRDLILMGSGGEFVPSSGSALGIQIGVSNGAEGFTLSGSRITGFSTGATFGNNTFNTLFSHDIFINNTKNMVYPDTLSNAGEHMVFDATSFANSTTANVAGCVTIHGTTGLSMIFTGANFDSCQLDLEATGAQQAHISMTNPYFEDPAGHSAAPMVLNNGGAYLTIDSPTFYSDSSFPAYPITVAGQGGTYVHGIRIFGTGATAAVGVDASHKTFIFGSVFDSENPSLPSYGYTGTASGTVTLIGDDDQTNQIFSNADPGLVVRSGSSGASDSAVAISGQYFWSLLWSGVGQSYYPNGIASLGPHSLGFCYGDSGALPVVNIHCDDTLTDGVMNTTAGYSIGGAHAIVTAKKDVTADGTVVLATDTAGSPVLTGMYAINWEPGPDAVDRRQEIVAHVDANDVDTSYLLTTPSNNAYLGHVVLSNLRVVGDTAGRRQLVVDVGNRNSTGTDSIRVTRFGDISYTPTLFPTATAGSTALTQTGILHNPDGSTAIPSLKSTTGTRYLCIDTAGKISSSASACSGT